MAAKIPDGFVLLARRIEHSKLWQRKPDAWLKIWIHIFLHANFMKSGEHERGEGFFSYTLSKDYLPNITENQWHRCIDWLRDEGQIETQKSTRGLRIKIVNYEEYQDPENYRAGSGAGAADDDDPEFERWFSLHPWQVQKDKARRQWRSVIKRGVQPADLIRGLTAMVDQVTRGLMDVKTVPRPANWIRNGCWKDVVGAKVTKPKKPISRKEAVQRIAESLFETWRHERSSYSSELKKIETKFGKPFLQEVLNTVKPWQQVRGKQ